MAEREEPIWTGRYGQDRIDVIEKGQDYLVATFENGEEAKTGMVVQNPGHHGIGKDDPWTECLVVRAYNAEDACRNFHGALGQWKAWFDRVEGVDWETAPFTDEEGNFLPEGGNRGEGYDAFPPDDTAKDGVTLPEIFSGDVSFVHQSVDLRATQSDRALPRP